MAHDRCLREKIPNITDGFSIDILHEPLMEVPPGAVDLFPRKIGPRIFLLQSGNAILKAGPSVEMCEAAAMQFVAKNTSIPVPKVIHAYVKDGNGSIFMTKAQGTPLGNVWKILDIRRKTSIVDDDGNVAGIVDWESAGFSIRGRDYTEAKLRARDQAWVEAIEHVFPFESRTHSEMLTELNQALTKFAGF